jgi:hypothetical protein
VSTVLSVLGLGRPIQALAAFRGRLLEDADDAEASSSCVCCDDLTAELLRLIIVIELEENVPTHLIPQLSPMWYERMMQY